VLLVLDKSGSMSEAAGATTKMAALKAAVSDLLDQGDGQIRFGLSTFPSDSSCGPGSISVECSDTSINTIRLRVNGLNANGGTPTGETLQAADAYQGLHDAARRNFVLLVTDGIPTCPNADGHMPPNSTQQQLDQDAALALQAVQTLHGNGIDTFVIGLGEGTAANPTLLNQMAEAGGQPRVGDPKYYQVNSQSELQQVLTSIGGMVIGCNLALGTVPEYPNYLWVFFNGVQVPRDKTHANGWDYDGTNNQINFYGGYCDQLRTGAVTNVDIKMGCAPPT
jgi:hypothetical protein